jgi:hypothetical protein
VAIVLLISLRSLSAATGEENLLLLHNGGMICGIMPQIGGRVVVFRQESGDNVLDARPELWKDAPTLDLLSTTYKQYYGESVWAGPQAIWWTADEPYPPPQTSRRLWPPDPAWELAPFTIVEQTPTRVVLRSPISKLTGLELTKTIELFDDGQLRLQEKAVNRGDKVVTRDLWLLHRVNPTSRCFFPLKSQTADFRFIAVADFQKIRGLDVMQLKDGTSSWTTQVGGKLSGVAQDGWMASSLPGAFFVVRFQPSDETKMAPDQAPDGRIDWLEISPGTILPTCAFTNPV